MKDIYLPKKIKAAVFAAALIAMVPFMVITCGFEGADAAAVGIAFGLIYAVAAAILILSRSTDRISSFLFALFALSALVYIRVMLLYYRSGDYNNFLVHWVGDMRGMSAAEAMRTPIGDYNMPYMYLLLFISRMPCDDIILIKAFSCLFDVLLAWAVMLTVGHLTGSKTKSLVSFFALLALPTVTLNGAMWGQCDAIYAFFCVLTFYLLLKKRGSLAMLALSAAFSVKLQTVFIFPAVICCLFTKKLRFRDLVWFPAGFAAASLPALIAGRSFADTFMIYINQTQNYASLDMNCPTVFRFVYNVEFDNFNAVGIMLGGLAALTVVYAGWRLRRRTDGITMLKLFCLSAISVVYFLPRMHERYYFLADVFTLMLVFAEFKLWYVPAATVLSSFVAYAYYLFGGVTLIDYRWLSLGLLAVQGALLYNLCRTDGGVESRRVRAGTERLIGAGDESYACAENGADAESSADTETGIATERGADAKAESRASFKN